MSSEIERGEVFLKDASSCAIFLRDFIRKDKESVAGSFYRVAVPGDVVQRFCECNVVEK